MSQKYELYLYNSNKCVENNDTCYNIPAEMLVAIDYKDHYVLVVDTADHSRSTLTSMDEALTFMDARAKALSWADKPQINQPQINEPTADELALLDVPGVELVPSYGNQLKNMLAPEFGNDEGGWKFFIKPRGSKDIGTMMAEADIALVDFRSDRVVAEHANGSVKILESVDDVREFYGETTPEMVIEPKEMDAVNKAVDPNHYKGYIDDLQWIDAMSKIPSIREPARFIAALELQIRKYMDRNGAKDLTIQEWKKARFYLVYLVAYIENDYVCIPATEIHKRIQGL